MIPDYQLVNGHRFGFSSIEAIIAGRKFIGFKAINYFTGLEPGEVRGAHPLPLGHTRGKGSNGGSLEMYREEWEALTTELVRLGGGGEVGFLEVYFQIVVNYGDLGAPTITDTLKGVRLKKATAGGTEGSDGLTVPNDLTISTVKYGGKNAITPLVQTGLHFG